MNAGEEESAKTVKRNFCKPSTKKGGDITHASNLHYCSLIKKAILRQEWQLVMKLLIAFIDEPKVEIFTSGIILKVIKLLITNGLINFETIKVTCRSTCSLSITWPNAQYEYTPFAYKLCFLVNPNIQPPLMVFSCIKCKIPFTIFLLNNFYLSFFSIH